MYHNGQFILYLCTMSANAAYQEWLKNQNFGAVPISQEKSHDFYHQDQAQDWIHEQTKAYIGLVIVLVLLRICIGLKNWFSKYLYFKAKRQQSFVHSLYYTFLYQSGSGKILLNKYLFYVL